MGFTRPIHIVGSLSDDLHDDLHVNAQTYTLTFSKASNIRNKSSNAQLSQILKLFGTHIPKIDYFLWRFDVEREPNGYLLITKGCWIMTQENN